MEGNKGVHLPASQVLGAPACVAGRSLAQHTFEQGRGRCVLLAGWRLLWAGCCRRLSRHGHCRAECQKVHKVLRHVRASTSRSCGRRDHLRYSCGHRKCDEKQRRMGLMLGRVARPPHRHNGARRKRLHHCKQLSIAAVQRVGHLQGILSMCSKNHIGTCVGRLSMFSKQRQHTCTSSCRARYSSG